MTVNKDNNKIATKFVYQDGKTVYICDVVEIDNIIYTVRSDCHFHPINNKEKVLWSTSYPIIKKGTIEEFPEYFI